MAEIWAPEHVVDTGTARALIAEQFPDLPCSRLSPFGVGWDNTAYLVDDTWVFRFPRRAVAVPLIEREARLLPAVAPRLPLAIPVPVYLGRAGERYPSPFAGYRRIPGRTACGAGLDASRRAAAAEPLGRFLAALHAFPADEARGLGAEGDTIGRMDVALRVPRGRGFLAELREAGIVGPGDARALEEVMARAPAASSGAPVLVHGDLYGRHLLVDDTGEIGGVIDWGDVHVGDRAVDLSIAHAFLPPRAREAFRQAYGDVDDVTWARAGFRAAYHAAMIARYAQQVGDADLLKEAVVALRWIGDAG